MCLVQTSRRTDRKTYAVQGKRVTRTNCFEITVRRSAGAHIILGMNFEKSYIRIFLKNFAVVFRFKTNSGTRRNRSVYTDVSGFIWFIADLP